MKRLSLMLLIVAVLAGTACRREPVGTETALVSVVKVDAGIRITNNSTRGVAYDVSNPNWLGLLAICNDPGPACVRLAVGESVVVPLAEIHGYEPGITKVTVHWWHVLPDGPESYKATDPQQVVITL